MNINPGKTEFSDAEHEALRAEVVGIRKGGISQAEIGRQADVPESSLSQYLGGKYVSEPGKTEIAQKLTKWLKTRLAAAAFHRRAPIKPTFVELRASRPILAQLQYARENGRMVVIAGVPGVSKTATARQFTADTPRTWYAYMSPETSGVPTMLLEVLAAMSDLDAKGTPQSLMRKVCNRASEAKGLLIVDEAQELGPSAIESLRSINDRVGLGIALIGDERLHTRIGPTGVKAEFARVSSRIAGRRYIPGADPADARDLALAWAQVNGEEITQAEVAFCQQIASKPGGLRNIEMTMEGALIAARGSDEPLGLEHLQGAFARISATAFR